jgi:hypothetical protein
MLLFLCVHGTRHYWERLQWICDVAELVRREPALDWDRLESSAARVGCHRMLRFGLHLAGDLLEAPAPEAVLRQASQDPAVRGLAEFVGRGLFTPGPDPRSFGAFRSYYLGTRERWQDRFAYWRTFAWQGLVPSEEDRAAVSLPAFLSGGYYLVRAGRLAGKYGARLFRSSGARQY